jgi:hypothetical protein
MNREVMKQALETFSGVSFLKRQHSNGKPISSWTLAAYHHPRSITWRWGIWYSRRKAGKTGAYFMRVYRQQGFNFHAGINLPWLGSVSMQTQPHMWEKPRATSRARSQA